MTLRPVRLGANTPRRFYAGGRRILAFRGEPVPDGFDDHRPEDWPAATTHLFGEHADGLTTLGDGRTLRAALGSDPEGWLGPEHLDSHGAEPGAKVWLGWRDDLDTPQPDELVDAQDERLPSRLNAFSVERGDAVVVPAGRSHAIGAGVFVLELQEPTDLSVMLEHVAIGLAADQCWLGLDRATTLGASPANRSARPAWPRSARGGTAPAPGRGSCPSRRRPSSAPRCWTASPSTGPRRSSAAVPAARSPRPPGRPPRSAQPTTQTHSTTHSTSLSTSHSTSHNTEARS